MSTNTPIFTIAKDLNVESNRVLSACKKLGINAKGATKRLNNQELLKIKSYLESNLKAKILGPVEAPIFKIKKNYRYRLLLRSKKSPPIQQKLSHLLNIFKIQPGIKLIVDVDPISFN